MMQNKSNQMKFYMYIVSVCSAASFVGLIGSYALIKKYMAEQLSLQQGFLGLLDSMTFLGRLVGYLYLTFYPSQTPKRDFFKHCIFATLCLSFISLIVYFPFSLQKLVLTSTLFLSGISRSYLIVPNMIMLQYFNVKNINDKLYINLWIALSGIGDVISIIFVSLLLKAGFGWRTCFGLTLTAFVICSVVLYLSAQQIVMVTKSNDQNSNKSNNNKSTIKATVEQKKQEIKQQIKSSIPFIVNFYSNKSNLFWMIQYSLVSIMYYNILMWFPYYFLYYGFQFQASVISTMYPTFAILSVAIFQFILRKLAYFQQYVITFMHFCNVLCYCFMILLGNDKSLVMIYILLVAMSGLLQGGPYSQVTSVQLMERTKNNRQTFLAITTCKLVFQIFTIFVMMLIGFVMQYSIEGLFWVLLGNTLATFLVNLWRIMKFGSIVKRSQNNQVIIGKKGEVQIQMTNLDGFSSLGSERYSDLKTKLIKLDQQDKDEDQTKINKD